MLDHTRINLVLAVMVSLCLGSVMSAQAPTSDARDTSASLIDVGTVGRLSQRAEALAIDVLIERACAPMRQPLHIPALASDHAGNGNESSSGASTGGVSGIEMPFFSFGGVSAE